MLLHKIWRSKNIKVSTKKKLVRALVFPVAMYGCETWTMKNEDRRRVLAMEMWCWRRMLQISWTEKVTNDEVRRRIGTHLNLDALMLKHKLTYFGHVVRGNGLEKSIMLGMGEGGRGRGRPRRRWMDEVTESTGMKIWEAQEAAGDRYGWRRLVMEIARGRKRPDGTR